MFLFLSLAGFVLIVFAALMDLQPPMGGSRWLEGFLVFAPLAGLVFGLIAAVEGPNRLTAIALSIVNAIMLVAATLEARHLRQARLRLSAKPKLRRVA